MSTKFVYISAVCLHLSADLTEFVYFFQQQLATLQHNVAQLQSLEQHILAQQNSSQNQQHQLQQKVQQILQQKQQLQQQIKQFQQQVSLFTFLFTYQLFVYFFVQFYRWNNNWLTLNMLHHQARHPHHLQWLQQVF